MRWLKSHIASSDYYYPHSFVQLNAYREYMHKVSKRRGVLSWILGSVMMSLFIWAVYNDTWLSNAFKTQDEEVLFSFAFSSILIPTLIYWWRLPHKNYRHAYRNYHARTLENALEVTDVECMKSGISLDKIKNSLILPMNEYDSEFHVEMQYKNVDLTFSEAKITSRNAQKYFLGSFVLIEFPKDVFSSKTIIVKDRNKVDEWTLEKLTKLNKVNLVDPVFEGLFDVFSDDQLEARFVFNPAFMEEYRKLSRDHHPISMSFYEDHKVFILIPGLSGAFRPNIEHPAEHNADIDSSVVALKHILGIVGSLLPEFYMRRVNEN